MPLGLSSNTWPLACTRPSIAEVADPVTRFRMLELAEGWTNWTISPLATEKSCQLRMALGVLSVMVRRLPDCKKLTEPLTIPGSLPPARAEVEPRAVDSRRSFLGVITNRLKISTDISNRLVLPTIVPNS